MGLTTEYCPRFFGGRPRLTQPTPGEYVVDWRRGAWSCLADAMCEIMVIAAAFALGAVVGAISVM